MGSARVRLRTWFQNEGVFVVGAPRRASFSGSSVSRSRACMCARACVFVRERRGSAVEKRSAFGLSLTCSTLFLCVCRSTQPKPLREYFYYVDLHGFSLHFHSMCFVCLCVRTRTTFVSCTVRRNWYCQQEESTRKESTS
jgi:hypothetical protein